MDAMAYVAVIIGGISFQSAEPVPIETCNALKAENSTTLCIDVEPPCGKGEGAACLGRADVEVAPAPSQRTHSKRRHIASRKRSSLDDVLAKAF